MTCGDGDLAGVREQGNVPALRPYKLEPVLASSTQPPVNMQDHTHWITASLLLLSICCYNVHGTCNGGAMYKVTNPCTRAAIQAEHMYHLYPHDPHRYIQCTTWGKAYVMMCPSQQMWSQDRQTCVEGAEVMEKKPAVPPQQHQQRVYTRLETPRPRPKATASPPPQQHHHESTSTSKKSGGGGINWPNPCNHPNIKYVPHPTNPQQYFSCENGVLIGHSCAHGEVWIQPSHACINIQDRIPHTESPNPCLTNSQQRYHPYPGDMHRYIECESWYKMQVWDCGEQAVWMQLRQSCVNIAQPPPVVQPPPVRPPIVRPMPRPTQPAPQTTAPPPPTQTAMVFCNHSVSFYHPYIPDSTKFIQCDEYGNMYIRTCGPKKRWNDFYKTCVNDLHEANVTDAGGSGAAGSNTPLPTVSIQIEPITYVQDFVQVTCPTGYVFNANGQCEDGSRLIRNDYNPNDISCTNGFLWDTQMQMCVRAIKVEDIPPNLRPQGPSNDLNSAGRTPDLYVPPPTIKIEVPEYDGPNPCLSTKDTYYFAYPGDARFFLQCDEAGYVSVVACPRGTMWTEQQDGYYSCMDWLVAVGDSGNVAEGEEGMDSVLGEDDLKTIASLSKDNEEEAAFLAALNPCIKMSSSTTAFFMYPLDPSRFIQCSNGRPYLISCAPGTMWDPSINTCGHLIKADQIMEDDEAVISGDEN